MIKEETTSTQTETLNVLNNSKTKYSAWEYWSGSNEEISTQQEKSLASSIQRQKNKIYAKV